MRARLSATSVISTTGDTTITPDREARAGVAKAWIDRAMRPLMRLASSTPSRSTARAPAASSQSDRCNSAVASPAGMAMTIAQPEAAERLNVARIGRPSSETRSNAPSGDFARSRTASAASSASAKSSADAVRAAMTPCWSNSAAIQPGGRCWRSRISPRCSV
jgi:hypothetical protein